MEFLVEAFVDTLKLLPLLVIIYFLVSFLEYRYGNRMGSLLANFGILNPIIGALFGSIPQCGFSVAASALYVKRLISVGTLLAVFISTSDEAVPVLLSMPHKANMVVSLIVIKIVIAIVAGIGIDLAFRLLPPQKSPHLADTISSIDSQTAGHSGCCAHHPEDKHSKIETLLFHPLRHTIKIFIFLLVLSALLNLIIGKVGEDRIAKILLGGTVFQPILASFIGLIPNCFASVLLAKLFADGTISFGSLVAGLCSAGGLGLLVLIKENTNIKNTTFVVALLMIISILAGVIVQAI